MRARQADNQSLQSTLWSPPRDETFRRPPQVACPRCQDTASIIMAEVWHCIGCGTMFQHIVSGDTSKCK
jgi:hypothetical protein